MKAPAPLRLVAVNERGYSIGQDHHRSKFSDHEVDLMIQLREEGLMFRDIAEKFECAIGTVHGICSGRRRAQVVATRIARRQRATAEVLA